MYQENQHNRSHSLLIKIISLIKSTLMMDHMIALAIWWTWPSRRVRGVEQGRESKRLSPTHRASFCNQKLLAEKLNWTNNQALNIHLHLSSFQMHSLSTLHWVSLFQSSLNPSNSQDESNQPINPIQLIHNLPDATTRDKNPSWLQQELFTSPLLVHSGIISTVSLQLRATRATCQNPANDLCHW